MQSSVKDIQFNLIVPNAHVTSHKQALPLLAKHAAKHLNISQEALLKRLNDREEISSSAIGSGVAIPNAKMRRVRAPFTMLMTLDRDLHHATPDNAPISMYGLLISPADDGPIHLRRLSRISRLLINNELRERIRETQDKDVIQSLLINPEGWLMAA